MYMVKNISPHVNIYKFPVTAVSSILTRLSGLYLSGAFVVGGISQIYGKEKIEKCYNSLSTNQKTAFHYSLIVPANYHTLGGIRHFIWDKYPHLLTNPRVAASSYALFGMTLGTSILVDYFMLKT